MEESCAWISSPGSEWKWVRDGGGLAFTWFSRVTMGKIQLCETALRVYKQGAILASWSVLCQSQLLALLVFLRVNLVRIVHFSPFTITTHTKVSKPNFIKMASLKIVSSFFYKLSFWNICEQVLATLSTTFLMGFFKEEYFIFNV